MYKEIIKGENAYDLGTLNKEDISGAKKGSSGINDYRSRVII